MKTFQAILALSAMMAADRLPAGAPNSVHPFTDFGIIQPVAPEFRFCQGYPYIYDHSTAFSGLSESGTGTGYHFSQDLKWQAFVVDMDGNGIDDLATVNNIGELYITVGGEDRGKLSAGWGPYDPVAGWCDFAGDFNGDGKGDIAVLTEFADRAWVGLSNGTTIPNPSPSIILGFRYLPYQGFWIGVGDMNGDGRDDLVQCTPYKDAWVALANSSGSFDEPTKWGVTGFKLDYTTHDGIQIGDFNGDGKADLLQVTSLGEAWVATSTGTGLSDPVKWAKLHIGGGLDFRDAYLAPPYGNGFTAFPLDYNHDGLIDLIDLTPDGQVYGALSTGSSFDAPTKLDQFINFGDQPITGPNHAMIGNFSNSVDDLPVNFTSKTAALVGPTRGRIIPPSPTPSVTPMAHP